MKKIIIISISILILTSITIINIIPNYRYVTSKYSKYCYFNGEENKNIKVKIYYKDLLNCGKPLKY